MNATLLSRLERLVGLQSVPSHIIVLTALASYAGLGLAALQGWPVWAVVLAGLLPWLPILTVEMVWTYRHYHWLALFYVLVLTQSGHFGEHLAQMVQIHLLGLRGPEAHGIFGALDVEWVHFIWNTWVLLATLLLLARYRRNRWLWLAAAIAAWHETEHAYLISVYLATGREGTPGLLAAGGAFGGGLPLSRPNLHFLYNLLETTPLVLAFAWQLRYTYDEWLARAFPHLPAPALAEATSRLQSLRFAPGEAVVRQGDPADRFYIITRGEAEVLQRDAAGREAHLRTLGPGQFFGEIGLLAHTPRTATVRATSALEVLVLDREAFRGLVERSEATAQDLARVVQERLATSPAA